MESDSIQEPFLNYQKDEELGEEEQIKKTIRGGFISKVFGIVLFQLILTSMVVALGFMFPGLKNLMLTSNFLLYLNYLISLGCLIFPLFNPRIFREVPYNYILLIIFTLSYSWLVAAFTCQYSVRSVMIALFLTTIVVGSLTVYAWYTSEDFTALGGILFTGLVLLFFSWLILMIFPIPFLRMLKFYFGLILFCIYLVYDIQIVKGGGMYQIGEDDYIIAAINIYLDIIMIFIHILSKSKK
jgi:hypothetical protein